ncbi:hypothetical protein J121_970 [Qipengyuania citrea LAMA 915]|uniref:Uncharacterized protein n=1 Tax=Qipengyuania citrea LAMA 915 TaxID=1306953 RepID=A0A0L1KG28_9SPHN|nr:hypothetical protein J121_970 [Qipengyuania citrea LAMA 915]
MRRPPEAGPKGADKVDSAPCEKPAPAACCGLCLTTLTEICNQ